MTQPRTANVTEVRAHLVCWGKQNWWITMVHEAVIAESHTQSDGLLPSLTVPLQTAQERYTSHHFWDKLFPLPRCTACSSEISRMICVGNTSKPFKQVPHCPNIFIPPDSISPSHRSQGIKDQHWGKIPCYLNVKTFYLKSEYWTSGPISHRQ